MEFIQLNKKCGLICARKAFISNSPSLCLKVASVLLIRHFTCQQRLAFHPLPQAIGYHAGQHE